MLNISSTKFFKAHALGNDFILVKTDDLNKINSEITLKINDRFQGIGCNQLLVVDPQNNVKIWDEDGSIATLCGNGLRCLAKLLNKPSTTLHTDSGPVHLFNLDNGHVSMQIEKEPIIQKFDDHYLVNIGNLNKIYFVENNSAIDIESYKNKKFNYSFISRIDNKWSIRTMEYSTEYETYACGSASLASAYALKTAGYDDLCLHYRLGYINHHLVGNTIIQTGPATIVAEIKFNNQLFS